jgi:hypothetical protein
MELECLFIFYVHDILIFSLNFNNISLNIKPHVNFVCLNEWLCMMQIFFVHINI